MLTNRTAQRARVLSFACVVTLLALVGAALAASDDGPRTVRASSSTSGDFGANDGGAISADGRFVVFTSPSPNLAQNDENGWEDTFVRDLKTGKVERVSVSKGREGNGPSRSGAISNNGRYVAFLSHATNLVPGQDRNGQDLDAFVRDRKLHKTTRVSVSSKGKQGVAESVDISGDGRVVVFASRNQLAPQDRKNAHLDVFARNLRTRKTQLVSMSRHGGHGDAYSTEPSISDNGRFVAFTSHANNLVANDKFPADEVVLRDMKTRKTRFVSVNSNGVQANRESGTPAISGDGRFVSFWSIAPNLASGHTSGVSDIFLRDVKTRKTEWVSVNASGGQAQDASFPVRYGVSAHGKFVVFYSSARDFVPGDTSENSEFLADSDVFVRNVAANTTRRVSVNTAGEQPNGNSFGRAISDDGRFVTFLSEATNLGDDGANKRLDVYIRGPLRP